ncbi:helix-turn-helix domain-containing protein [Collinsella sp. AGMB00827]|uniref:Helix-turn-helix domain-containing protein n=1 Tax=Collinsella ureilytica TaxID=2869515 RepID=A0ABS7MJ37_9ACTN|nr:helix-turn-helix transcriptional regulator [Collinsella urealyticum]MBY4797382.1 helix-turn-helix domain-containing protein [Collinsella urealyticum]
MFGGKYKGGLAPLCARKIKNLREKRQLTQKQLAELSGISESALRSYELGDRKPKKEVLEHIAKALRVRPEYLSTPEFGPKMEFFYALLENDELMGYTITEIDGRPAIVAGGMTAGITFSGFLRGWNEMKQKLDAKEITRGEYEDWKQTYDSGHWVNTPDGKSPWTRK